MDRPLAIAVTLAACAGVPMGDPQRDAALKAFAPAPGTAGLFVFRQPASGIGDAMHVLVDGTPLGRTRPGTYVYREVAPGRHVVASRAENVVELEVDVGPGALAYVRQASTWGVLGARSRLELVDEAVGREAVRASRLAESRSPTQAVEVRVEADDPAWRGPLACSATNGFGRWTFEAPGTVVVAASGTPLRIECGPSAPDAGHVAGTDPAGVATASPDAAAAHGPGSGAAIGAAAGVALGVAAAPVMGPAFAVLLAAGGALRGAEIGAVASTPASAAAPVYPSPVVVRIGRDAPRR